MALATLVRPPVGRVALAIGDDVLDLEMAQGDAAAEYPIGFTNSPYAMIGPRPPFILPPLAPPMSDLEGVDAAGAMDHLLWFTIVNDDSVRDLVHEIKALSDRDLIACYARWYAFQPGDVLTTGSPAGAGHGRNPKIHLRPGDQADMTVDGLSALSNPAQAHQPPSALEKPRVQSVH